MTNLQKRPLASATCLLLLLTLYAQPSRADQPPAAAEKSLADELPRIPPVEPQNALATFEVARGFRMELVACEPDVSDPVDACFDEFGRMYVAEMHDYPFSYEPTKLNPQGGGKKDAGIIRLLEDTDGDGVMDKSDVFADKISWPLAVCCYRGGVFVIAPADIYYFKDTDGDRRADVREIVYSGFSRDNVQGLPNNMKWGLDNRIYFAAGRNGGDLSHRGKPLFPLRGNDLAFNPLTEEIADVSGGGQFGHSFDDWGHRFVCSNSNHIQHIVYPQRYLERNPFLGVSGVLRTIAKEGAAAPVFRKSPPEPWRIVRTRRRAADPEYRSRLPATELVATGFFTSATGVTIYRGDAYPEEYRGNTFVGDVGGNLIHRKTLQPDGASFLATRADEQTEFVTSTDNWFRPVNFVNAPDGTLYVLDMYRETIEHPASIPEDIKAHLDLQSGSDRGRIWRLVSPGMKRRTIPRLGEKSTVALVAELESPNAWNRETAARLIWERQDRTAVKPLLKLATSSPSPLARMHALYALDGLNTLAPEQVIHALADEHPRVREHAVLLAEQFAAQSPAVTNALLERARTEDSVPVMFQLAFSLGELPAEPRMRGLTLLASRLGDNADVRIAWLSSAGHEPDQLAAALVTSPDQTPQTALLAAELARMTGSQPEPARALQLLQVALRLENRLGLQARILESLGEGLSRRGSTLNALLADPALDAQTRDQAGALFAHARAVAADEDASLADRRAAVKLLAFANYADVSDILAGLLLPSTDPELQLDAVDALAEHRDPGVPAALLAEWRAFSPNVRRAVTDSLLSRSERIGALLDALANGDVRPAEIDADKKQILLNHADEALRTRAQKVFGEVAADRAQVIAAFEPALEQEGVAERGREVYVQKCSVCHKLGDTGHQVGPELASVVNKSPRDLLIAILDPNREAQPNYNVYTVVTLDGKSASGIIAAETGTSITLRRAEGKEDVILRSNIDTLVSSGTSLMPVGFEKEIAPEQMADLIAFVKSIGTSPESQAAK